MVCRTIERKKRIAVDKNDIKDNDIIVLDQSVEDGYGRFDEGDVVKFHSYGNKFIVRDEYGNIVYLEKFPKCHLLGDEYNDEFGIDLEDENDSELDEGNDFDTEGLLDDLDDYDFITDTVVLNDNFNIPIDCGYDNLINDFDFGVNQKFICWYPHLRSNVCDKNNVILPIARNRHYFSEDCDTRTPVTIRSYKEWEDFVKFIKSKTDIDLKFNVVKIEFGVQTDPAKIEDIPLGDTGLMLGDKVVFVIGGQNVAKFTCSNSGMKNLTVFAYDASTVYSHNVEVHAYNFARIYAYGESVVEVWDHTRADVFDKCGVYATDFSRVACSNESHVEASGFSSVDSFGKCTIGAMVNSKVVACENTQVFAGGHSKVFGFDKSNIEALEYSIIEAEDLCNVTVLDDSAVVIAKYSSVVFCKGNNKNIYLFGDAQIKLQPK